MFHDIYVPPLNYQNNIYKTLFAWTFLWLSGLCWIVFRGIKEIADEVNFFGIRWQGCFGFNLLAKLAKASDISMIISDRCQI